MGEGRIDLRLGLIAGITSSSTSGTSSSDSAKGLKLFSLTGLGDSSSSPKGLDSFTLGFIGSLGEALGDALGVLC